VSIYTTDAFAGQRISRHARSKIGDDVVYMDGIKIYEFKSLKIIASTFHAHLYISPAMISIVRKNICMFDVIHLHEYRTFQNIIVGYYARKKGIPYVIQAHGSLPLLMANQRQKMLFDMLWGRRLLEGATKIVASTLVEAQQYQSMGIKKEKIVVVPNAIDLSDFQEPPLKGSFRAKHNLQPKDKIILFLARIHKIKGLDLLAEAFAELLHEKDDVILVIAGPDFGYLDCMKRIVHKLGIEDKVLFTGPLYGSDKLEAFADADVYVLPSIYETFPVSVLEACACGTPVIVTDRCGIANMIDGQVGYAVPFDKDRLKAAFVMMLNDEKKRAKFGEQGRLLVHERFTWSKVANQMENIYSSCLQSTKSLHR